MARIHAGTSGFAYPAWKPDFYPQKLPQARFLEHYASRLNSVEINYTFRRHPTASTLEKWVTQTPEGFLFSLKAHQRITHFQRLADIEEPLEFFFAALDPLRTSRRLGVVLFQLPPNLVKDAGLLARFVAALPDDVRCAVEFRHPSWHDEEVWRILSERNVCFCLAESDRLVAPRVWTADFAYYRLRKSEYPAAEREEIRDQAERLTADGKTVFVYFKHEESPAGALYAEGILGGSSGSPAALAGASPT